MLDGHCNSRRLSYWPDGRITKKLTTLYVLVRLRCAPRGAQRRAGELEPEAARPVRGRREGAPAFGRRRCDVGAGVGVATAGAPAGQVVDAAACAAVCVPVGQPVGAAEPEPSSAPADGLLVAQPPPAAATATEPAAAAAAAAALRAVLAVHLPVPIGSGESRVSGAAQPPPAAPPPRRAAVAVRALRRAALVADVSDADAGRQVAADGRVRSGIGHGHQTVGHVVRHRGPVVGRVAGVAAPQRQRERRRIAAAEKDVALAVVAVLVHHHLVVDALPVPRLPQVVLDLLRPDQAPRTALRHQPGQKDVQLQALRQGLRVAGRAQDAHPHAHAALQVHALRQGLLAAVAAAGPHPHPHGREALLVSALLALLRRPVQPARPPADALGRQALLVQAVRQDVLAHVAAHQTRGRRLSGTRRRLAARQEGRRLRNFQRKEQQDDEEEEKQAKTTTCRSLVRFFRTRRGTSKTKPFLFSSACPRLAALVSSGHPNSTQQWPSLLGLFSVLLSLSSTFIRRRSRTQEERHSQTIDRCRQVFLPVRLILFGSADPPPDTHGTAAAAAASLGFALLVFFALFLSSLRPSPAPFYLLDELTPGHRHRRLPDQLFPPNSPCQIASSFHTHTHTHTYTLAKSQSLCTRNDFHEQNKRRTSTKVMASEKNTEIQ